MHPKTLSPGHTLPQLCCKALGKGVCILKQGSWKTDLIPFSHTHTCGLGLAWGGHRQQCHQHEKLLGSPETMWGMVEHWGALRPWGVNKGALRPQVKWGCSEDP